MYKSVSKRGRRMGKAEQDAQDVRAWLMISAIFIGTMLVVWVPLIFNAMRT